MSLTSNLNTLLSVRHWTSAHLVAALADRGITVTQWTVERWLAGQTSPRADMIPEIAAALGVEPNDLFADCAAAAAERD